ncbi:MAG: dienelactone hydrolase family protein [Dehalococcoidia bacterium]|nr:dienelactone hydrolase family protein [Dehalococcoidia bacterium]
MPDPRYLGADTSWVEFGEGTRAFLALPERFTPPYGAVVLGHERYGLVQHTLDLVAKFAAFGYVAIAPDMASHWDGDKGALNRGELRLTLTPDQVRTYMSLSMDYLAARPEVDPGRIAAMGVCASGGYPHILNAARPDVAANIVFYGGAEVSDEIIGRLTAPTLGVFGEGDHTIPIGAVQGFRDALERNRKSYQIRLFAGMPHGWLNDTMPGRYRQREADEAWALIIRFLERVFSGGYPSDRVRWQFESESSVDYDYSKNVRLE